MLLLGESLDLAGVNLPVSTPTVKLSDQLPRRQLYNVPPYFGDVMNTDWMTYEEYLEARFPQRLQGIYSKPEYKALRSTLRAQMPRGKVQHSVRVGDNLVRAGIKTRDVVDAGLFHDFLERGGDIRTAARTLGFSDATIRLINLLSNDEKYENPYLGNGPLLHIQHVLSDPSIDPNTKNYVILIKIADRIDNLNRRLDMGNLSRSYMRKSKELLTWLFQQYHGDPAEAMALRKRLKDFGIKIKKKHVLQPPPQVQVPQVQVPGTPQMAQPQGPQGAYNAEF